MNKAFLRLLMLAIFTLAVVPYASVWPDGLERAANQLAITIPDQDSLVKVVPGDEPARTSSAWNAISTGIFGATAVFGGLVLVGKKCVRRS